MNDRKIARAKRIGANKSHKVRKARNWDHLAALAAKRRDERKGRV